MGEIETEVRPHRKRKVPNESENSEVCPEKKIKNFCCQSFRQEIKGNEVLKSLKRFIAACKDSDDVVLEYLEQGGSLQEILSIIDVTAPGDLTTALPVFETVHLILLRCQSADSKYHQKCLESARNILHSHIVIIKAMLSMSISKHKKVALKVLTTIATLDSSFANEIMNLVALSPTLLTDLIKPSSEKESVRKCFIMFVLSFLIEGNVTIVRNLLDKKGFVGSIIPGLKFDDATTVNLTLSLFEDKILKNIKIQKTLKLKLFNTQIIKSLFDLYDWKGPRGAKVISLKKRNRLKEVEVDHNDKQIVVESVHSFLLLLCCSQKYGVAFHDKSFGISDHLNNQLLLTVFESIPDPLKTKKIADLLLRTIVSCPDLMKPMLLRLEPSFQPRNSKNWFQAMDFAENLLKAVDVATMLKTKPEPPTASDLVKAAKILCAPVPLLKICKWASRKSETMEIRFRCFSLLMTIWKETQKLIEAFRSFRSELEKHLRKHLFKSVPDAEDLVELWHTLCDTEFFDSLPLPQEKKVLFLSIVLESFCIILKCHKGGLSSLGLASDLLGHIERIRGCLNDRQFEDIQVQIVKLLEKDVQFLVPSQELFDKSLQILLQSTDDSSLSYLSRILASLEIFARNKAEIDVWLSSYMSISRDYRASVANFLIEALRYVNRDISTSDLPSITPLIFNCVEVLKFHISQSPEKKAEQLHFGHFLNDVVVHLQFYYGVDVYLHERLKRLREVLSESTLGFLKAWKKTSLPSPNSDVLRCPAELTLASWVVNGEGDPQDTKKVVDSLNGNLLKLYSLFRMVIAYATKKSVDGELSESDVDKFSAALLLFLCNAPEDDRSSVDCISFDLTNRGAYQRACLECLFRNEHILAGFDIFQRKRTAVRNTTALALRVQMEEKIMSNATVKKALTKPWKAKFLQQLKSKLKKNKFIDYSNELKKVLEFFEYDHKEAKEVVELFVDVSDLDLFAGDDGCSVWTAILSKFIKIYCEQEELSEAAIKKLCTIMKHLCDSLRSDLAQITDCFIDLLREHPSHLLLIDNDFLEVILLRTDSAPATCALGKLLLNDPKKVRHFLKFISINLKTLKEPQIALSLLSNLIVKEDSVPDAITFQKERSLWKINEIGSEETTGELIDVLEAVYQNFKVNIFRALLGQKEQLFLDNVDFTRCLIRLFLDGEKLKEINNEILKGRFQPELLYEAVKKVNSSAVNKSFLQGLLTMFCRIITNDERDVAWEVHCDVVSDMLSLDGSFSGGGVVESPEWKEFAKLAVGHCLSSAKVPSLLKIFRLLVTILYKAGDESKDCALFFQMFIAHSQFLKVMLGDSTLKSEAVELFRCLVERSPSQMTSKHFPILLASYSAGMSSRDIAVLDILRLYERSGVAVSAYEPFAWGETAVSHYSIGTSPGLSLWQRFNMRNVLDLLDEYRLELSLKEFPIWRDLEVSHMDRVNKERQNENILCDANIYDPAFILPLFVNLMSPGAVVYSLAFIYKGGLAYTVRALSSECKDVRLMASVVLTRFYNHLELSQNLKQKLVWMHFINRLRYGVEDLSDRPLPNVATLFLARMTLELSREPGEMYSPLQNYLLAKSYFAFDTVPEFLPLFHSSGISHCKHREWLLKVLKDGTRTTLDVATIFHSMALKVIFCFFHSPLCDVETKKLILQLLERMLRVEKSAILISDYGLLSWINAMDATSCQLVLQDLLELLLTLTRVIVKDIKFHRNKHSNTSTLIQILNVAVKLLESLKSLKPVDVFRTYLKVIRECLVLFVEEKQSEWFNLNKDRLFEIVDVGTVILGNRFDCKKLEKVPFYFRSFDHEGGCEVWQDLRNCVYLFKLLENNEPNEGNKKGSVK